MSAGRRNSKVIFIIYIMVAVIGYFILPMLLERLPANQRELLSRYYMIDASDEAGVTLVQGEQEGDQSQSKEYLVCSIDDDPDGTNAYGIYDPTDLAVTVRNLARLNTKHLFLGTHLHWPDLPLIENNTLRSQLELLDSCILSTPLRRAAESTELPYYLLNSSVTVDSVKGGIQTLPKVNNLSLAPTMDVPENFTVGFSQLESEPTSENIPLLAVWGDRVILSSLLLELMHQLGIQLEDLEITVGKYVILGDSGRAIQIDEFGYFSPDQNVASAEPDIISADITSVEESPVNTELAIITASGVKADSYRAIENPVQQLTQLRLASVNKAHMMQGFPLLCQLLVVLLTGALLSWRAGASLFSFWGWALLLAAGVYFGSAWINTKTSYFIPMLSILMALIFCMLVKLFLKKTVTVRRATTQKEDVVEKVDEVAKKETKEESPKRLKTLAEKMEEEFEGDFCDLSNTFVKQEIKPRKAKKDTSSVSE